MNSAELLAGLHQSLATKYPTRRLLSARPGRVTCVVVPASGEYDDGPQCDPWPMELTTEVHIVAADISEKGAEDLMWHIPLVADLIRQSAFTVIGWRGGATNDTPTIIVTATANGDHG